MHNRPSSTDDVLVQAVHTVYSNENQIQPRNDITVILETANVMTTRRHNASKFVVVVVEGKQFNTLLLDQKLRCLKWTHTYCFVAGIASSFVAITRHCKTVKTVAIGKQGRRWYNFSSI